MLRNRATLDRLVRAHLPAALRLATRLTGSSHEAEDVIQDALLKAVRGWPKYRGEAAFKTWLFRIVVNAYRDRSKQTLTSQPLPEVVDALTPNPTEQLESQEIDELIRVWVRQLPARQREVFVLATFEGMSTPEIAETLSITPGSVYANLHHARSHLENRLQQYNDQSSPALHDMEGQRGAPDHRAPDHRAHDQRTDDHHAAPDRMTKKQNL